MHMENGLVVIHLLYTARFFSASYYDISAPAGLARMAERRKKSGKRYACRKNQGEE